MEYYLKYYGISGLTLVDFNNDGKLEEYTRLHA